MRDLTKTYTPEYFAVRERDLGWRTPIMATPILDVFEPQTVVDVACGDGHLVAYLRDYGIEAYGIEGTKNAAGALRCDPSVVRFLDLRRPFENPFGSKADVVTMFNAIDHIEPELVHSVIKNLATLSDLVIFNAPDFWISHYWQKNVRDAAYWEEKCARQGLVRNPELEAKIKPYWESWKHKPGIRELYRHLFVFEKQAIPAESES